MYAYVKWHPFFMLMSCKIVDENVQLIYKIPIFASIKRLKRQRCNHYCSRHICSVYMLLDVILDIDDKTIYKPKYKL